MFGEKILFQAICRGQSKSNVFHENFSDQRSNFYVNIHSQANSLDEKISCNKEEKKEIRQKESFELKNLVRFGN